MTQPTPTPCVEPAVTDVRCEGTVAIKVDAIAHNTILNLVGQALPLLIGVITVPIILKGLGIERFGLLALCWVVLGYFGMFDLGLGRATTRAVAELLGRGELQRLPALAGTCLLSHAVVGLLGGLAMAGLTPVIATRVLKISPALVPEARTSLLILSAAVPVVVSSAALRGILEAGQRFALVNWVKAPSNSLVFLIPAIAAQFGLGLPGIVLLIGLGRLGAALAYWRLCYHAFPVLRNALRVDVSLIAPLLSFGSWVTVSNVVGPVLAYLDRFLIGSIVSVSAVAYYTGPYELVARLWILPWSLVVTLFPAFAVLSAHGAHAEMKQIYGRSVKAVVMVVGPILLLLVFLSRDILRLWLGTDFALASAPVLRILAIGVLVVSAANVPFTFFQSLGRADIPAKFHLLELPIYVGLAYWMTARSGIVGAAWAWTTIMTLDGLLLFGAAWKKFSLSPRVLAANGVRRAVLGLAVAGTLLFLFGRISSPRSVPIHFAVGAVIFVAYTTLAWRYVLDARDKNLVGMTLRRIVSRPA